MLVERAMHPRFLSNTYLVAAEREHDAGALFVDAGGPIEPLLEAATRLGALPTHVLLTHHHFDHVSEAPRLRERWPGLRVLIDARERELLDDGIATGTIAPGEVLRVGALEVRALHTPGHTAGMLSFVIGEPQAAGALAARGPEAEATAPGASGAVFTGDTLFEGSVGGVRAPGHTTYADLRESIMGTLMALPPDTVVHPGHASSTTVGAEWERNAFIRVWRGLDPEGEQPCTALGEPATLVLLGDDYDGGHKAWVRWPDGSDDIVPGSRVVT